MSSSQPALCHRVPVGSASTGLPLVIEAFPWPPALMVDVSVQPILAAVDGLQYVVGQRSRWAVEHPPAPAHADDALRETARKLHVVHVHDDGNALPAPPPLRDVGEELHD